MIRSFGTMIFYALTVILLKKSKSLEKISFISGNAILSILLKYQEIDVQIQPSLTKTETSYILVLLNSTY